MSDKEDAQGEIIVKMDAEIEKLKAENKHLRKRIRDVQDINLSQETNMCCRTLFYMIKQKLKGDK